MIYDIILVIENCKTFSFFTSFLCAPFTRQTPASNSTNTSCVALSEEEEIELLVDTSESIAPYIITKATVSSLVRSMLLAMGSETLELRGIWIVYGSFAATMTHYRSKLGTYASGR